MVQRAKGVELAIKAVGVPKESEFFERELFPIRGDGVVLTIERYVRKGFHFHVP